MNKIAAALLMMLPLCAMSDILPPPLPGEMPLHRIGYEIVFEILTALTVGGATFRALLKRRWKLRDEISMVEHESFRQKIDSAMPRLIEEIVKADQAWPHELKEVVTRCIADDRELAVLADGVPMDEICEALCKPVLDPITGQCRFGQETGDKLKTLMPRLRRILANVDYNPELDHKTLLEKAIARNDDLKRMLDGVPIELVNESLVPLLPAGVRVNRDSWHDGSLWMTAEDRREEESLCRNRHKSHYERMREHELEEAERWAEIRRLMEQQIRVRDSSSLRA